MHGMSMQDHKTMYRTVHSVAASNRQPIPNHQTIAYLYDSLCKFPPFHLALQMYDRVHVTLEQRTVLV
jgi:hypothetical protein